MAGSKRIVFSFDERSYNMLKEITERGKFGSMAQAVREALRILRALQQQEDDGFDKVIVRKGDSTEARVLLL